MNNSETERLKKQIDQLKSTIDLLNKNLKESESLKSNFISNIMNEVYNPFSSILSMSENIIDLKDENINKAPDMAKIIYREAAQLDFHLQNIFSAATIEAGLETIENTNFNINEILISLHKKFALEIKNKNLIIKTNLKDNSEFVIYSDKQKLCLILTNLFSNSIKHSPENGQIEFYVILETEILKIQIKDQGEGIPTEKSKEIFDRFKRLDNTINSVSGGYGLGLSIVNAYVELLDGEIEIDNRKGTLMEISIPLVNSEVENEDEDLFSDEELF